LLIAPQPCTLPALRPQKGGTKRDLAIFSSKIQLLSKKFATVFVCVKTSSSKVVATSFLCLTVHRRIAGDVPIYQTFALKETHPVAFHFFVAANRRYFKFKCGLNSKSRPTDDKPSLKSAWPRHVTHFKLSVSLRYLWNCLSYRLSNLVYMLIIASPSLRTTNCP